MTTEEFKNEVQRIRPTLILTARRFFRDDETAEDMVQDALLKLWSMTETLKMPLEGLAIVVVKNLCISRWRTQKHIVGYEAVNQLSDTEEATDDEWTVRIIGIIDQLPAKQQLILRLRHIDNMTSADIAALMGTTDAAVRKQLSRARQAVRDKYLAESRKGDGNRAGFTP